MSKEGASFPIFSMVNDFESKSFHIPEIKTQHRSLYYFLLGVLVHRKGSKRFEIAYDYGMAGAKIGNHKTYTTTLKELEQHGFLKYTPGKNRFSTPIIDMQFCKPTENLLKAYRESIGVSTANNIKAKDTKEAKDALGKTPELSPEEKELQEISEENRIRWGKFKEWFKSEEFEVLTKIENQLTPKQLAKLFENYGASEIKDVLIGIDNYKKSANYTSVYRTVLKWLKREAQAA